MRSILSIGAGEFPLPSVPSRYFSPADSKMTYNLLSTLSSSSEPGGISIVMSGLFGLDDRAMRFVALDIR